MPEAWRYRFELWKVKDCASDPDADPGWAIRHCRAGQARLVATIEGLTDWTIVYMLTHVACKPMATPGATTAGARGVHVDLGVGYRPSHRPEDYVTCVSPTTWRSMGWSTSRYARADPQRLRPFGGNVSFATAGKPAGVDDAWGSLALAGGRLGRNLGSRGLPRVSSISLATLQVWSSRRRPTTPMAQP